MKETKLRRQDLSSEFAIADGYESFFSCTRTVNKGRAGYSGVATFCRVKPAFSSTEPALPMSADEGITGILRDCTSSSSSSSNENTTEIGDLDRNALLLLDSEGRCVITDHGHFVLFNIYGPRAEPNDEERLQFKRNFFRVLQRRWEKLLEGDRRIIAVGDFNIAPTAMDRCDPDPDFENNYFRRWFRSLLETNGGKFSDCFRFKHTQRKEAFTCWPSNSGAELFNYGTRIDHIICAGSCLDHKDHSFFNCHVADCDILTEYKRWTDLSYPGARWKGGLGVKLEGSDHAPVYMNLTDVSNVEPHSTPSMSSRYLPMICGVQQTIVSMLKKREVGVEESGDAFREGDGEKRGKRCQLSQVSLRTYFGKSENATVEKGGCVVEKKNESALAEWRRIRDMMQNSVPLCKGHKEPCVSRVVKKAGPNLGKRFYVCARAEGPASNREANCGYFKWACARSFPK